MRISNPLNLDDEMVQCTVEHDDDGVEIMTFSTIDDLRDFIAHSMKGTYTHDYRSATGGSHGIFSGYFPVNSRDQSRY